MGAAMPSTIQYKAMRLLLPWVRVILTRTRPATAASAFSAAGLAGNSPPKRRSKSSGGASAIAQLPFPCGSAGPCLPVGITDHYRIATAQNLSREPLPTLLMLEHVAKLRQRHGSRV